MTVADRQKIEREIAAALIADAIAAGYTISVDNGEEVVLVESQNKDKILEEMFSVDDEYLHFSKDGRDVGWVRFVYGNEGWDVICDYTVGLEHLMDGANKLSDKYQEVV